MKVRFVAAVVQNFIPFISGKNKKIGSLLRVCAAYKWLVGEGYKIADERKIDENHPFACLRLTPEDGGSGKEPRRKRKGGGVVIGV